MASRPDAFRRVAARRGGQGQGRSRMVAGHCAAAHTKGLRPDGSEHRGTSPAVRGELRRLSARPAPSLGVLLGIESRPPGCLNGLQPRPFGLGQLRQASWGLGTKFHLQPPIEDGCGKAAKARKLVSVLSSRRLRRRKSFRRLNEFSTRCRVR